MRLNRFRKRAPLIIAIILLLSISKTSTQTNGYLTDNYKNLEGEILSFGSFEGSHLLVFAMATWCGPCIEQHHEIAEIHKLNYSNFEILTLSVDPNETIKRMIEYKNSYGNPWSIGIISNGSSIGNLNISAVPTLMLFNTEGRLLNQKIGYTEFGDLKATIGEYVSVRDTPPHIDDITSTTSDTPPHVDNITSTTSDTLTIGYSAYSVVLLIMFPTIIISAVRRYMH